MLRKRQLDKDSVHAVVGIEFGNQSEKLLFSDCHRTADCGVTDADKRRSLRFPGDIGLARRVVADKNHDKMRDAPVLLRESLDLLRKFRLYA